MRDHLSSREWDCHRHGIYHFPLQRQCFLLSCRKTRNEMAISDRQTDAVLVTRICPLYCLFYLADSSKTGQRPFSQRGDRNCLFIFTRGQWRQLRIHDHVFTKWQSRAIHAFKYVSAIAISNGGSNGQYRILRLIAYPGCHPAFYQTVFPPGNTLTMRVNPAYIPAYAHEKYRLVYPE